MNSFEFSKAPGATIKEEDDLIALVLRTKDLIENDKLKLDLISGWLELQEAKLKQLSKLTEEFQLLLADFKDQTVRLRFVVKDIPAAKMSEICQIWPTAKLATIERGFWILDKIPLTPTKEDF